MGSPMDFPPAASAAVDELVAKAKRRKLVGVSQAELDELVGTHGPRAAFHLGYRLGDAIDRDRTWE